MQHLSAPRAGSWLILLALVPGSLAGQLPQPPDGWWTNLLQDGAYPTAVLEYDLGMTMTITQSIKSIDGATITETELAEFGEKQWTPYHGLATTYLFSFLRQRRVAAGQGKAPEPA